MWREGQVSRGGGGGGVPGTGKSQGPGPKAPIQDSGNLVCKGLIRQTQVPSHRSQDFHDF